MLVRKVFPLISKSARGPGMLKFSNSSTSQDKTSEQSLTSQQSDLHKGMFEHVVSMFEPEKRKHPNLHKLKFENWSISRLREWGSNFAKEFEIAKQRYIPERHAFLGYDLAAAHFIIFRGGKVKFFKEDSWIAKDPDDDFCDQLPNKYQSNLFVEAIDASNTAIRFEGLVNLVKLKYLKWLSFKNCPHVDDWFIDRLSGEFCNTLEYLDISDCHNVTYKAMSCMYRFKKLKKLIITNIVNDKDFEYSCLVLEEKMPNLVIEGVQYITI